jgi:putative autotransporter adhesin-like protein
MNVTTKNAGSYVTEERVVSGFSCVSLRGVGRVRLQQTGTESLEVRAPQRWMNRIETRVQNGTLILGFKKRIFPFPLRPMRLRDDIEFRITADVIEELGISGAGSLETGDLRAKDLRLRVSGTGRIATDSIEAEEVRVTVSGNGKISADRLKTESLVIKNSGIAKVALENIVAEKFYSSFSGLGSVRAKGSVCNAELRISGAGSFLLEELETSHCKVRINGAGKVRIHAKESLETNISGAGSVYYKGMPQRSGRTSGSGRVRRIDDE